VTPGARAGQPGPKPEPKPGPVPLRACLPALRAKALLRNARENLDALNDLLERVKGLQKGDVLPPSAVSRAEREVLQARLDVLRRQKDVEDALDHLQVLGVKAERLKAVEKEAVDPVVRHLRRFDEIAAGQSEIENQLAECSSPESAPRLRAELLRQFTESALVKGTKFADGVRDRCAVWKNLSDVKLSQQLQQVRGQERRLLERQAELKAKDKSLSPADQTSLAEAEAESNLGSFEAFLRRYEADYTEGGKPKRSDLAGEGRRAAAFRNVEVSALRVLFEARDERLRAVRVGWPGLPPIEVDKTALVTCKWERAEGVVASRVKAPKAAAAARANLRSVRLLAETYRMQQHIAEFADRELQTLVAELESPPQPGPFAGHSPSAQALFEAQRSRSQARERLLRTWFDYQAARLDLFRDLGVEAP
jgi:hypothetical protein